MRTIMYLAVGLAIATTTLATAQAATIPIPTQSTGPVVRDPSHKPKKGIIYNPGRRITTCTSWGKEKDFCKK